MAVRSKNLEDSRELSTAQQNISFHIDPKASSQKGSFFVVSENQLLGIAQMHDLSLHPKRNAKDPIRSAFEKYQIREVGCSVTGSKERTIKILKLEEPRYIVFNPCQINDHAFQKYSQKFPRTLEGRIDKTDPDYERLFKAAYEETTSHWNWEELYVTEKLSSLVLLDKWTLRGGPAYQLIAERTSRVYEMVRIDALPFFTQKGSSAKIKGVPEIQKKPCLLPNTAKEPTKAKYKWTYLGTLSLN